MNDIITQEDLNAVMRSSGALAYFHETVWRARMKAPLEAAKAAKAAGASVEAFSLTKFLLPGVDGEYRAVCNVIGQARAAHKKLTVPWGRRPGCGYLFIGEDGQGAFEYLNVIAEFKQQVVTARGAFKAVYNDAVQHAQAQLGSSWNSDDYIGVDEIDDRFDIEVELDPIPLDSDWLGMPTSAGLNKILTAHTNSRGKKNVQMAITAGLVNMSKYVQMMATRLSDPDTKRLYSSMVSNIKEVVDLVEPFNIVADDEFAQIIADARFLTMHTTDQIRDSETIRKEKAEKAVELTAKLEAYRNRNN